MDLLIKLIVLLPFQGFLEAITVNCGATSPASPTSVTCSCKNSGREGIEWWEGTTDRSHCIFSFKCSPNPRGYTFLVNQTEQTSTMTVNPYNYGDCQQFTCKDFSDTSIQQSQIPSIIDFDSTMPSVIAEPVSNNTSGDISITTSCITGYSDLIAEWYIVVDGAKKQYIPDTDIVIRQINTAACIACNSESAATIKLGFQHEEAVDNEALEGYFQLELHHPEYPSDKLVRKTTNVFKVADFDVPKFRLQEGIVVIVVISIFVFIAVAVLICVCSKGRWSKKMRFGVKGEENADTCSEKSLIDEESVKICDTPSKESLALQEGKTTLKSDDESKTKPYMQKPQITTSKNSLGDPQPLKRNPEFLKELNLKLSKKL